MGVAPTVRNLAKQKVLKDFAKLLLLLKLAEERPVFHCRRPGILRRIVAT